MRYLLNYSKHHPQYAEYDCNCQTFAADFFGFLCNDSSVSPYASVNKIGYKPNRDAFLYAHPRSDVVHVSQDIGAATRQRGSKRTTTPTTDGTSWKHYWTDDAPVSMG